MADVLYDWAHPAQHLLAKVTAHLRRRDDLAKRFVEYHYDFHMELVKQRRAITSDLHQSLLGASTTPYSFSQWQRTIRWQWDPHPLCTVGSMVSLGGRFNIGRNIDPVVFQPFSAFYVAKDKDTAHQEALGQNPPPGSRLSSQELALANTESITTFSVSGHLDSVLDITDPGNLRAFVRCVKDFKLSKALIKQARGLPVVPPRVVATTKQLQDSLLNPNWRHVPALCEIPANSQIFGQIVMAAGIEGILYPSKLTGQECLAIFPTNFRGGGSWLQLDDQAPKTIVGPTRIDHRNFEACERGIDEIEHSPLRYAAAGSEPLGKPPAKSASDT